MDTNENIPRYRAGQVVLMGKASLTSAETIELRRLFDLVADTCDAAGEVVGRAAGLSIGSELARLREIHARVDAMVDRIGAILG